MLYPMDTTTMRALHEHRRELLSRAARPRRRSRRGAEQQARAVTRLLPAIRRRAQLASEPTSAT
jgi:hypothetical protein